MTQQDEFVTGMVVNVIMLTRLDKNVNKIPFLDVNVNNFLLNKNVNIFLLEENVKKKIGPKCQYVPLDQKC